ncbi:reverse transcriptase domain-containing protein [Planktothrix agardhii]|jgi:RNA-directed DNA polymerase|uniref:reverse transcriptase domain-containing protein n=1 Tax=Planktothrix agardhii TaxID=1160 RepID=UPI001D0A66DF|nr:reverse transcriptase domain-containing protein [Planktothrix agardhii]MCF3609684.1 reverse transcriptase family protein [Planktothrix agardhii 1033]MCB8750923.1 reverse transcriptase family protein [Planktothrix agardhii 1810]MCB8786908.1 reverse transcriptase family protein [Planktothrix agardhii 1025]MCF3611452.1 reverse transcriptase family protein [Planktothrix agardhii 1027]MCF3645205.1 reverse transcriptase family protein [Planktothrix agardhii 1026]
MAKTRNSKSSIQPTLRKEGDELRKEFFLMKIPRDVAQLLEIPYQRLVYHIYIVPLEDRYLTFDIKKKSGGNRNICAPATALKIIQKKLNQVLQFVYKPKPSVHGFVLNKNIATNAKPHAKKRYVLNVDLKDFFPSINFGRVRGLFMALPYGLSSEVATVLAQICCYNNQLPQGAPTSPIVSNMICAKMDSQLQQLAKKLRCTYTRYADDITFSTTLPKFPKELAYFIEIENQQKLILGDDLLSIIKENNFEVNERKIRLQSKDSHQEVTGLTVNQFVNIDRNYIRQVRAMLHAWEKFGLEDAEREHQEKYYSKYKSPYKVIPNFKHILRGKIEYIGMIKGKDDRIYKKYLNHYIKLHKNSQNKK